MNENNKVAMEKIVSLAKRRGFVYPGSEIYGGLANTYDYGPVGAELMRNIRNIWWKEFVHKRNDMIGIDTSILLHPETWVASGHVDAFNDSVVEDMETHKRYRADHLIEEWARKQKTNIDISPHDMTSEELNAFIKQNNIKSPEGNEISEIKQFNQLFETGIGAVAGKKSKVYLRGETAQGIFTNFKQILDSTRVSIPFGVGQIGKSFRNEITTGQFIFRTLEFEQAEIEYFFDPDSSDWKELLEDWKRSMYAFVTDTLGIHKENIRWRRHSDAERSHYSLETYDLDYNFPFGWDELWGVAYRTDYDLRCHIEHSGVKLEYIDPKSGKKLIPHIIEPALGLNRVFLMILSNAYFEDDENDRIVLRLPGVLAPYKVAVFPLLGNKPELVNKAEKVRVELMDKFPTAWDARGNIGKRYYAQDEIGTPYCVTIDFDTLEDNTVTVRDRDTTKQERIPIESLISFIEDNIT